ncbi:hypothetical protein VTL71DRAFT_8298 [Oculimacula yallundae]|uniref:Uncharacterized protein n=1 Tax=Oculimacula yallundae TaxID=86028 RepID=A0ABR4CXA2_9HELO
MHLHQLHPQSTARKKVSSNPQSTNPSPTHQPASIWQQAPNRLIYLPQSSRPSKIRFVGVLILHRTLPN